MASEIGLLLTSIRTWLPNTVSQLTQEDFTAIIDQLRTVKIALQTYAALASAHRDLRAILFTAGQPLSELDKCNHLIDALNKDAAGIYAAQLYVQAYPLIHHRTFNGLVAQSFCMLATRLSPRDLCSTLRPLLLFQPSLPPHLFLLLAQ
jgi:hypothetical protein